MKKFLVVMSYLALASSLWAADFSLNPARDFGAIRRINPTDYDGKSVVREDGTGLSSDTAAAFRAALEVFSKAEAEPAGAVAAHAADTSTHGVATVAGLLDVTNLQAAANASDALLLRLDGSREMTGNLKFSGNYAILRNTNDETDNGSILIGNGDGGYNRGSSLRSYGNEHASSPGQVQYFAGNVSGGDHIFYTGAGVQRFRIGYDGKSKFSGDVIMSGGRTLHTGTDDSSDNSFLTVAGGGANSSSRGAEIDFYGNEHAVRPGHLVLIAGNDADGGFQSFWTQGTERMRLTYGGNLLIGTTTDDGTNKLQVNGSVAVSSFMQLASPTAIPTAAPGRIYFNGTESKFKKCLTGTTWVDM